VTAWRRSPAVGAFAGFGAALVVVAIAGAMVFSVAPLWRARSSLGWSETRCQIECSEVEAGDESYRAEIEYTYEAAGRRRPGDRIDFAVATWSNARAGSAEQVARYPAGSEVPCWYDRDDPSAVTLSRTAPESFWLLLVVGLGAGGLSFLQLGARRGDDSTPGSRGADGRWVYVRRCARGSSMVAFTAMWWTAVAAAVPAFTVADSRGLAEILAWLGLATLATLHELRCLFSVVTVEAPAQLFSPQTRHVAWSVRCPLGSPRATASLVAVATTETALGLTVEAVLKVPIRDTAWRPGVGTLSVPPDAPASTPVCQIDWYVEVHVRLPLGPHVEIRVPLDVRLATAA